MSESEPLSPRDQAERVALFRAELIGAVSRRELSRGELAAALRTLAAERYLPPGSKALRYFGVSTFERWLYAYRAHGLAGLRPAPRSDRGRARDLTPEQRELLLEIRREHPTASVPLILRTLVADGRLAAGVVSDTTVARLYRDAGLERGVNVDGHTRLRWQADHAGALWHGDVCHGPTLRIGKTTRPLRIHAMLDDASRFVVALEALHAEREADMLDVLLAALRRHGAPDAIYLDNGSTYRGEALRLCCERLGITLIHARPYDAPARGKMERFWRTLRAGCIDHLGAAASLHDVQVRLAAFVDEHYHRAPHGGLYGKTPAEAWAGATCRALDEPALAAALTIHRRRRVRKDGTVDLDGRVWQLDQGFLAGRVVTVVAAHAGLAGEPVALHDGHRYPLRPADPVAASRTRRTRRGEAPPPSIPFDPAGALLDKAAGRRPRHRKDQP
jgi:transposase InsO family protein